MKIHLGCGKKYIPGWYHIDVVDLPHIDLIHEVSSLPMLLDCSVSLAYASHVLEHFCRMEVPKVLQEWHRILRPGGVLRLAVPDFAAVVDEYKAGGTLQSLLGLLVGSQRGLYEFHHTIFDEATLTQLLINTGFTEICRYDWRATSHAWLDDYSQAYLPHLDRNNGRLMSLNIEAKKS